MAQRQAPQSRQEHRRRTPHRIMKRTRHEHERRSSEPRRSSRLNAVKSPEVSNTRSRPDAIQEPDAPEIKSPNRPSKKRKRNQPDQPASATAIDSLSPKRLRTSDHPTTQTPPQDPGKVTSTIECDPIRNWVLYDRWPAELFQRRRQVQEEPAETHSLLVESMDPPPRPVARHLEDYGSQHQLCLDQSPRISQKQSDTSFSGTGNRSRASSSAPYRLRTYETRLAIHGSHMQESQSGVTEANLKLCEALLNSKQNPPLDTPFRDDLFANTCARVLQRNEAKAVRWLLPSLVPSAEYLAAMGASHLERLIEFDDEAWSQSIPIEGPQPKPDWSIGFQRNAFTEEQHRRLRPLVGELDETSFFVATNEMYFPFFACEVKSASANLIEADRQNAHSMTIAVRGVVELYRAVNRLPELHGEILAFSISCDPRNVRIYGHYPTVHDGLRVTYHRHEIADFNFVAFGGQHKWTSYRFTRNLYDLWLPTHRQRICSAVDELSLELDFEVPAQLDTQDGSAIGSSAGARDGADDLEDAKLASQDVGTLPAAAQMANPTPSTSKTSRSTATRRVRKAHMAKTTAGKRDE